MQQKGIAVGGKEVPLRDIPGRSFMAQCMHQSERNGQGQTHRKEGLVMTQTSGSMYNETEEYVTKSDGSTESSREKESVGYPAGPRNRRSVMVSHQSFNNPDCRRESGTCKPDVSKITGRVQSLNNRHER